MTQTHSNLTHHIPWVTLIILSFAFTLVSSSALTTTVAAGEKLCFYGWIDNPGQKAGLYFAVQSGGSFDIDWTITDPRGQVVIEGEKHRIGDYVFTAHQAGEYSFCFDNEMSSFTEKVIDFEIIIENEPRPTHPLKQSSIEDKTSSLEDSIYKLSGGLSNIQRTQKYFRTRENRNSATVQDTQNRIFYFNIGISMLLIGISFTQVWIVRKFFNSPSKYIRV